MEHHNFAAEEYQMVALGNSALENKEEPCDDNDDSGVNDLKTLLASSSRGKLLLLHYTTCNEFTSIHRSHLADLLIAHELQKDMNKGLNREIFIQLTMKIVNTFPTEDIDNWIINAMYPDKIVFDGKLIRRYNTWVDVTKCAPFSMVPDDYQITTELDDEQNSVVEVSLAYLKIATTPWSTIEDLWIKTERSRNEDILTLKVDIYDYFQAFPCLREPLGYTLFEKDFQFLYPASFSNLFAEWPKLSIFIKHELQKKDENFLNGNVSSEKRVMSILMHLSQIFPVVTAMVKSGVGHWRPSRAEAQASFFLVVKSHKELQPIIERRSDKLKKYGLNLQPLPVIIGNTEMYHQCFIIFDTVVYEVDNPLKALDLTFKIFHAFQMQYPPECEQIWTFLQKAVYKIHTDNDKVLIGTSDLIIKYNNFQERKLHVILSN